MTRRFYLVLTWAIGLGLPALAWAQETGGTAFRAASPAEAHKENLSSIPFLVSAYLVIWALLFLYLYTVRRRQHALDREIAELRSAVEAATRKDG